MLLEEICVSVGILLLGLIAFLAVKAEKNDQNPYRNIKGKKLKSSIFYVLIHMKKRIIPKLSKEKTDTLKKIYPGKGIEEIYYLLGERMLLLGFSVVMLGMLLAVGSGLVTPAMNLIQGYYLKRDVATGQKRYVDVVAKAGKHQQEITIPVLPEKYSEKERKKKFREAKQYIERNYLGGNKSENQIISSLNLMTTIPKSAVSVTWSSSDPSMIKEDGTLLATDCQEAVVIELVAVIRYRKRTESISKTVVVLPVQKTKERLFWEQWQEQFAQNEKASNTTKYLFLPEQVGKQKVSYQEKVRQWSSTILLLTCILLLLVPFREGKKLQSAMIKREKQLKMDFPEMIERFTLLVEAGLSVKGAWLRITQEYEKREEKNKVHYVYEEMILAAREMENGMSEAKAYELFGKRTGLLPYMKFSTLLVQNLKKGTTDLIRFLDFEVEDAFHERRENAKVLGEEAGTKLLFPMMLMLSIVFALILYAAFQSM